MTNLLEPQERIRAAVRLGESHFREFKSAVEGPGTLKRPRPSPVVRKDISEALVAFANADGGELLVGVEDDGTVTGVTHGEQDIVSFLDAPVANVHLSFCSLEIFSGGIRDAKFAFCASPALK